jgi:hypothetical protein
LLIRLAHQVAAGHQVTGRADDPGAPGRQAQRCHYQPDLQR